jgi:hypothetical protein
VIKFYNSLGILLLSSQIPDNSNQFEINTSNVPDGLYTYKVEFEYCPSEIGKFLNNK